MARRAGGFSNRVKRLAKTLYVLCSRAADADARREAELLQPQDDPTPPPSDREPDPPSTDPVPDVDDAMLERLEADLATIEAAMDRVDSGDLEGYGVVAARLDDEISDST